MSGETAVMISEKKYLSADDVRQQVGLIRSVLESVMKKDIHYGTIPGTPKPTLYKPGAEKILMTFRLVADSPSIEDLSTEDSVRYRVTQRILDRQGNLIGSASGECSSDEDKYKWRRPVCEEEYSSTAENRRGEKWIKDKTGKGVKVKRIRTNPADVANTILKMAVKRALVAATLVCTAASDVFDQDIEDLPPEVVEAMGEGQAPANGKPEVRMPKPKSQEAAPEKKPEPKEEQERPKANNPISQPQAKRLFAIAYANGYSDQDVHDYLQNEYSLSSAAEIEREYYDDIVAHFQTKKAKNE